MGSAHTATSWFELGNQQRQLGKPGPAEASYRQALTLEPGHGFALVALGAVLIEQNRAAEAETLLSGAAPGASSPKLEIEIVNHLALAQKILGKRDAALASLARAQALDPERTDFLLNRFHLLDDSWRFAEAAAAMKELLARDPLNPGLHNRYNHLLHQMGREEEFLASYDKAPKTTALLQGKAMFLLAAKRGEEAHAVFGEILAGEPENLDAAMGDTVALNLMGRHGEAAQILERILARRPGDPHLTRALAGTALQGRDAQKAAVMAERAVASAPNDQHAIAILGTAWRMMGDERDEILNGYDELIRVFDLEPPDGFSDMTAFNEELEAQLAALHPPTREFLMRSLRGGTQTVDNLFGAGHDLVERLKTRIAQCVERYIAELKPDAGHPFRRRRGQGFAFAGSWSSRLADCGFHINHIHAGGWISSCYYAGVPRAVEDDAAKQGWIKFGEPGYEKLGVGVRRAIKPKPGRLVLFPSYMWHGTVPFHEKSARTTIAFDVVPR